MDENFINWVLVPAFWTTVPFFIMYIRSTDKRKRFVQRVLIPLAMLLLTTIYTATGYYYFLGPELAHHLFETKYLFLLLVFVTSTLALQRIVAISMEVIFGLRN